MYIFFKPLFKKQASCRFEPCCSLYALEALRKKSFFIALKLIVFRLAKCHPFGSYGYDPIPDSERLRMENL